MSENNAMTEGAASEEDAITAQKKQLAECWAHVVRITLGWMSDINDRMPAMGWMLTSQHRKFIEFVENMSEDTTFDDFKYRATRLMQMHAMARNDIYDGVTYITEFDHDGRVCEESRTVSREEKDVLVLCNIWWDNQ